MIVTTPAGTVRAHQTAKPVALPAVLKALGTVRTYAVKLFYRYIDARIKAELNGPVRPFSRRGGLHHTL